ncbi:MAG TPA: dienelactone hydrolase family protein [Vicinamibacterales bacterium]|nr:dienelactone hydrolase family protein [Vicinamibacterales bacterium]
MCHEKTPAIFPSLEPAERITGEISGYRYVGRRGGPRLAVLPDIYGCNEFYRGYASYLAELGAGEVLLINPFEAHGELEVVTRETAFARRDKISDRAFVDAFVDFSKRSDLQGVVGFCLGGLYVFELARRQAVDRLVAYYPFPQGLKNQEPLDKPFDYLESVTAKHLVLVGDRDPLLGEENLTRLRSVSSSNHALVLHVAPGASHGFLGDLSSEDPERVAVAREALAVGSTALFAH